MKIRKLIMLMLSLLLVNGIAAAQNKDRREFRGGWIHIVGNTAIKDMSRAEVQAKFLQVLDSMQQAGCNAVIFQVRPCADAFYVSRLEPWSRYLTGKQGAAPAELWDPLQFMLEESHKRGMEFHAWCNPYRVTLLETDTLCAEHVYYRHPEIFVRHGKQLYFNPAEPLSRELTVKVIADIVNRYDVDAIHFDDYFYPYPIKGEEFNDQEAFSKYAKAQGFGPGQLADWRRYNVELLIRQINDTIKSLKPWVRFGISPFGIHRNKKDTPDGSGSDTNGLSNYDELYADIPHWAEEGIIDYYVPQLYWKIGHRVADYKTLIKWWNQDWKRGQLYIGQSISSFAEKDLKNPALTQMPEKMYLSRVLPHVSGNVWWPAWSLVTNVSDVQRQLRTKYQKHPALIPAYTELDDIVPDPVSHFGKNGRFIEWKQTRRQAEDPLQQALFYAVYRFPKGVGVDISKKEYLIRITPQERFNVVEEVPGHGAGCKYAVTVIDRCWNESAPSQTAWF